MSLDLRDINVDWQDWLTDELCSLDYDTRINILVDAMRHNSLGSLMASQVTPMQQFRLACTLRDIADLLEAPLLCE